MRLRWIAGTRMCDDQSPSSWRISSAKSVSSAWMPPAASASLSPISSVVSDLTFTTSSAPCARATSSDDRVRLGRVARPVHVPARGRRRRPRTARGSSSRRREDVGLDRAAGLAQLLPVGQLGDDARRACRGSCRSRCARFARSCAFASSARAASGNAHRLTRLRRREDLGEVQRADRRAAAARARRRSAAGTSRRRRCRPRRRLARSPRTCRRASRSTCRRS